MASFSKPPWPLIAATGAALAAGVTLWWMYKQKQQKNSKPKAEEFTVPVAKVDQLCVYPLKSCHRLEVDEIECLARGFKNDRCWVVVDKEKKIVYQNRAPKLATVIPRVEEEEGDPVGGAPTLILNAPGMETLTIHPPDLTNSTVTQIKLFNMAGESHDVGDTAAEWISRLIGIDSCRVMFMSATDKARQLVNHHKYSDICYPNEETSFAQFAPVFIASQSSLDELNDKLESPVPMTRFRPNIVISGCPPHSEDNWKEIKIGNSCILRGITPGQRCIVTTVDQEIGKKSANEEPLKTLRSYRNYDKVYGEHDTRYTGGPLFGADYGVMQPGVIQVGDEVFIKGE